MIDTVVQWLRMSTELSFGELGSHGKYVTPVSYMYQMHRRTDDVVVYSKKKML